MSTPSDLISVSILDRDYQFTCPDDERDALEDAARYLDKRMREVKAAGSLMALERVAVMTALNLSDELLKSKSRETLRHETVDKRIQMLADELDNALDPTID